MSHFAFLLVTTLVVVTISSTRAQLVPAQVAVEASQPVAANAGLPAEIQQLSSLVAEDEERSKRANQKGRSLMIRKEDGSETEADDVAGESWDGTGGEAEEGWEDNAGGGNEEDDVAHDEDDEAAPAAKGRSMKKGRKGRSGNRKSKGRSTRKSKAKGRRSSRGRSSRKSRN